MLCYRPDSDWLVYCRCQPKHKRIRRRVRGWSYSSFWLSALSGGCRSCSAKPWKEIPLRNMALDTAFISSLTFTENIPTHRREKKKPVWGLKLISQVRMFLMLSCLSIKKKIIKSYVVAKINITYFYCLIKSRLNHKLYNKRRAGLFRGASCHWLLLIII